MLEQELEKYYQVKAQLQQENPHGGFVVIKDDKILGVWQVRVEALKAGLTAFGDVSFLVKDINEGIVAANFARDLKFV